MLGLVLESLFFIIPTYIANGCASLSRSIPLLKDFNTPIDFGNSWNGKRIFGNGKTFRGFIFGSFCGVIASVAQYFVAKNFEFEFISKFNNSDIAFFLILGLLLGFGGLLGDAVKSFVKRRIGIKRGKPWPPFDQLDFIIGGLLLASLAYFPGWKICLALVIITPFSHLLSNVIAYLLNLKDVWW